MFLFRIKDREYLLATGDKRGYGYELNECHVDGELPESGMLKVLRSLEAFSLAPSDLYMDHSLLTEGTCGLTCTWIIPF